MFSAHRADANVSLTPLIPEHATEFISVDAEISWIDTHEDVMAMHEQLIVAGLTAVKEKHGDEIKELFDVEVTAVNTINRKGKRKRTRAGFGKRPDTRRAIVSVDPNPKDASKKSRIDIFGGPAS